jgi:cysteine-rich repeat protein
MVWTKEFKMFEAAVLAVFLAMTLLSYSGNFGVSSESGLTATGRAGGEFRIQQATTISSCQTISASGEYVLNQSVNSSGTCFTFANSSISLDCAGFTITYAESAFEDGITASSRDNITIKNCNITSTNLASDAIQFTSVTRSLIQNNTISLSGSTSHGINFNGGSNNSIIGNNITVTGSSSNAINFVTSPSDNLIEGNALSALSSADNGIENDGGDLNVIANNTIFARVQAITLTTSADSNRVVNNTLNTSSGASVAVLEISTSSSNSVIGNRIAGGGDGGVLLLGTSTSNVIANNTINATAASAEGIQFSSGGADSNNITGNNIMTSGSSGHGIVLSTLGCPDVPDNNAVSGNRITTTGSSARGISGTFAHNVLTGNVITTSGSDGYGIFSESSSSCAVVNNTYTGNNITTLGSASYAVWFSGGNAVGISNHTLINNTISASGSDTVAILFTNSGGGLNANNRFIGTLAESNHTALNIQSSQNNTFNDTAVRASIRYIFTDSSSSGNNMTNTTFDVPANGSVRYPGIFTLPASATVNVTNLRIRNNNVFLDSAGLTFLNTTAELTLRSLSFASQPNATVDFNDDAVFEVCSPSICTPLSFSASTFVFNTTGFTAYAASNLTCGDSVIVSPETCDDGNTLDGDGCSSTCQLACVNPPTLSGLKGWWPGDGTAADVAGFTEVTLVNGATFAQGKVGQGFLLDGSNDFVNVSKESSVEPANEITVMAWINISSAVANAAIMKKTGSPEQGYAFEMDGAGTTPCFYVFAGGSFDGVCGVSSISTAAFHHVAGTYNGSHVAVYIDGAFSASTTESGTITYGNGPLRIGNDQINGRFFNGVIDEAQLYNVSLTASQIQSIFNSGAQGLCKIANVSSAINATQQNTTLGSNATYALTVNTTGNTIAGVYNLSVQNISNAAIAALNQSSISLLANTTGTVLLTVGNPTPGRFNATVTALLSTNSSINFTIPVVTTNIFAQYFAPANAFTLNFTAVASATGNLTNGSLSLDSQTILYNSMEFGRRLLLTALFNQTNVNAAQLVIEANATATAVNLSGVTGIASAHTLFVNNSNSNQSLVVCPNATSLSLVNSSCTSNITFTGSFPQTLSGITVSINGTDYKAENLTGTGLFVPPFAAPAPPPAPAPAPPPSGGGGPAIPIVCGDGRTESAEQCDDGNLVDGDGCSSACSIESCGDGTIHPGLGEQCDDGNAQSLDGCSDACAIEYCGDGTTQNAIGIRKGDGSLVPGADGLSEQCDDGNTASSDGCSATCQSEYAVVALILDPAVSDSELASGMASLVSGEVASERGVLCVLGVVAGPRMVSVAQMFGAAISAFGQEKVLGITVSAATQDTAEAEKAKILSRISGSCTPPPAPPIVAAPSPVEAISQVVAQIVSAIVEAVSDAITTIVQIFLPPAPPIPTAVCGNGLLEAGEQCDDGNALPDDGCSATCQLEERFVVLGIAATPDVTEAELRAVLEENVASTLIFERTANALIGVVGGVIRSGECRICEAGLETEEEHFKAGEKNMQYYLDSCNGDSAVPVINSACKLKFGYAMTKKDKVYYVCPFGGVAEWYELDVGTGDRRGKWTAPSGQVYEADPSRKILHKMTPTPGPYCGNNIIEKGEECEPPGAVYDDGRLCDVDCKIRKPAPTPTPTPKSSQTPATGRVTAAATATGLQVAPALEAAATPSLAEIVAAAKARLGDRAIAIAVVEVATQAELPDAMQRMLEHLKAIVVTAAAPALPAFPTPQEILAGTVAPAFTAVVETGAGALANLQAAQGALAAAAADAAGVATENLLAAAGGVQKAAVEAAGGTARGLEQASTVLSETVAQTSATAQESVARVQTALVRTGRGVVEALQPRARAVATRTIEAVLAFATDVENADASIRASAKASSMSLLDVLHAIFGLADRAVRQATADLKNDADAIGRALAPPPVLKSFEDSAELNAKAVSVALFYNDLKGERRILFAIAGSQLIVSTTSDGRVDTTRSFALPAGAEAGLRAALLPDGTLAWSARVEGFAGLRDSGTAVVQGGRIIIERTYGEALFNGRRYEKLTITSEIDIAGHESIVKIGDGKALSAESADIAARDVAKLFTVAVKPAGTSFAVKENNILSGEPGFTASLENSFASLGGGR